jgi:hypothetical protein
VKLGQATNLFVVWAFSQLLFGCQSEPDRGGWIRIDTDMFGASFIDANIPSGEVEGEQFEVLTLIYTPNGRLIESRKTMQLWCSTREVSFVEFVQSTEGRSTRIDVEKRGWSRRLPVTDFDDRTPGGTMGAGVIIGIPSKLARVACGRLVSSDDFVEDPYVWTKENSYERAKSFR